MTETPPSRLDAAIDEAVSALRAARTVVVAGHINPDGDALGSVMALTAALRAAGIDAIPTWGARGDAESPAPLEPPLSYLPCVELVLPPEQLPAAPDVLLSCDTAAASRLGTVEDVISRTGTTIVVDHHAVGEAFGDIRIIDDGASCTGVLALQLIDRLGVALTPGMADALYLALLTDTGRFSHASTTPADHRVAARLLEAGADHVRAAQAVYGSASRGFLALVARVTARAIVADDIVASWVTMRDLQETATAEHEPDGLIELLRKVGDVDVACLLRETVDGSWRSSLRSSGAVDVAAIARTMGGGGHRLAAGFTAHGDPETVIADVRGHLATASPLLEVS